MITKPILPPVKGYVEVAYDGGRCYKEIKTGKIFKKIPVYNPSEEEQQIADNELEILLMKQKTDLQ